jgi:hypothetical protein
MFFSTVLPFVTVNYSLCMFLAWATRAIHRGRWYAFAISRSVFLDFIHRLVSKKLKITRQRIKPPSQKKKSYNKTTNLCVCSDLLFYCMIFCFGGGLVLSLVIFGLLDTRRWIKSKNTLRLILIHHRQKPTEVIYAFAILIICESQGLKRPGNEADLSLLPSVEVKECVELYLHSPSKPWWRSAQLKHRGNFTFSVRQILILFMVWPL